MGSLHERNISLWVGTTPETNYPALSGDLSVDVAVIGAGITGLSTAMLLKQAGARVAVIEADRVASGTTGYTTAKITSLHTLIYAPLMKKLGEERAGIYGAANQAALERIATFVRDGQINCDFVRTDAFTYTEEQEQVPDIVAEVDASHRLGLPASLVETLDLPFPVRAAVRFTDQARFHPRKYCLALAKSIDGDGCHVFEMSRALDVENGSPCVVKTGRGNLRAEQVVLATQIPFINRGEFFAKTYPSRSYVVAKQVNSPIPSGMYIGASKTGHSIRTQSSGGRTFLIIGGEDHKVGGDPDTRRRYEALESWAGERFGLTSFDYRWSAEDYVPADNVPYIGRLTSGIDRIHVATGFKEWGMTTSNVAAMIISDAIQGRDNPWASLFDATRLDLLHSAKSLIAVNVDVAKHFVGDRLADRSAPPLAELPLGEGGIVQAGAETIAAYRDDQGGVHAVSPVCTHLGCHVIWNTAERTWDCPCHGSRFDVDGVVIHGPAVRGLAAKSIAGEPNLAERKPLESAT